MFPQQLSRDHLVLELDEDEGGLGDVADFSWAEHDALEGPPALGQQGEAAFAQAAQRAQQRVDLCGANLPRGSARNRSSSRCSIPTMKSSDQGTMITSPRAWRFLH